MVRRGMICVIAVWIKIKGSFIQNTSSAIMLTLTFPKRVQE